jgi:hypothetical protein
MAWLNSTLEMSSMQKGVWVEVFSAKAKATGGQVGAIKEKFSKYIRLLGLGPLTKPGLPDI